MLTTFTVNVDYDVNTFDINDSIVTLREAVVRADATVDHDTIEFDPTLDGARITLGIDEFGNNLNFTSNQGELDITELVTIDASMLSGGLTIDAAGNDPTPLQNNGDGSRIFNIEGNPEEMPLISVTLRGLTLTGGDVGLVFGEEDGGAIKAVHASLMIDDSIIDGNHAAGNGGGVFAELNTPSSLVIKDSVISGNSAGGNGGGIYSKILFYSNLTIEDSEISGNEAQDGGGVAVFMPKFGHFSATGSTFDVLSSIVKDNDAKNRGGGIFSASGAGGETLIQDSLITGNGAGITPVAEDTSADKRIHNSGGGMYAYLFSNAAGTASLTIAGTTISGNNAGQHGGGLTVCAKREGTSAISRVSIYNSTISGNQAGHTAPAPFEPGTGGGVHLAIFPDDVNEALETWFQNVTITENTADQGGGVYSAWQFDPSSRNDVRLTNSIVSANRKHDLTASNLRGSFNVDESFNNLLGDNVVDSDPDDLIFSPAGVAAGAAGFFFASAKGNIFDNMPMLGPLAFYGGLTPTHALLQGSLAIDAGSDALAVIPFTSTMLPSDQRGTGFSRKIDDLDVVNLPGQIVDIGAIEKQIALPTVVDVRLSGSDWTGLDAYSFYSIVAVGEQFRPIFTQGVDTLEIIFSESVNLAPGGTELMLKRRYGMEVTMNFDSDTPSNVAKWTFTGGLPDDKYAIHLSSSITAMDTSDQLDGDWANPDNGSPDFFADDILDPLYKSKFVTGNGMASSMGSNFRFHFALLAGDYDGDGRVEAAEVGSGDGNGDGNVDMNDDDIGTVGAMLPLRAYDGADFNDDEWVNWLDLGIWESNYGLREAAHIDGDADGDKDVDADDLAFWEAQYGAAPPLTGPNADFNDDGIVDGNDFLLWQQGQGLGFGLVNPEDGDANNDNAVSGGDFLIWQQHSGQKSAWYVEPDNSVATLAAGLALPDAIGAVPTVENVIISGSISTHDPFSFDTVDGTGSQLVTVPVGGADTIAIVFSENVNVAADSLSVVGLYHATRPTVAEFAYDTATYTAVWRLEGWWFFGDQYLISLTDAITDVDGNWLDGEWTNPKSITTINSLVSEFPSGDGDPGGNFNFLLTLLPGDIDLTSEVDEDDLALWMQISGSAPSPATWAYGDFNGNGVIDPEDWETMWDNFDLYGANFQTVWVMADLNGDFDVDDNDIQTISNNLGLTGATYEDGDLNGDGVVDQADLDLAFAQFGLAFDWVA